jgi:hypothetical protein
VLAADLGDGTDDPRATAPGLLRRALAALPPRARQSGRVAMRADAGYFAGQLTRAAHEARTGFAIGAKRITLLWRAAGRPRSTGSVTLPQPATPPTATSRSRGSPPARICAGFSNPSASRTAQPSHPRRELYARPAAVEELPADRFGYGWQSAAVSTGLLPWSRAPPRTLGCYHRAGPNISASQIYPFPPEHVPPWPVDSMSLHG